MAALVTRIQDDADCFLWHAGSGIARLKCDGTRAENRFGLSAKLTSPFKLAGVSVRSTTGSRGVRISRQHLYRLCSDVQCKATGYPLHSHLSPSLPPPVRHHVPSGSECAIRRKLHYQGHNMNQIFNGTVLQCLQDIVHKLLPVPQFCTLAMYVPSGPAY